MSQLGSALRTALASPLLSRSLQVVGACYVACQLLQLYCAVHRAYLLPFRPRSTALFEKYSKAGTWALVTGASDGIGRAIAIELARRGFNVIVVARTKSKLDVAAEIESYGREALAVSFDFSYATTEAYDELYSRLPMDDISVVVNNVGMAFADSHTVGDTDNSIDEHSRVINVNCEPMVRLSYAFAPRLKAKRCGAIVNLSSLSGVVGVVPYLATYAGTKAFNRVFSESLRVELKEFGVDVLTVTPGFVATAMVQGNASHRPRTSFSIVDVDRMARDTVDAIGRYPNTAGHRHHIVAQWLYERLPSWMLGNATLKLMKKVEAKQRARAAKQEN